MWVSSARVLPLNTLRDLRDQPQLPWFLPAFPLLKLVAVFFHLFAAPLWVFIKFLVKISDCDCGLIAEKHILRTGHISLLSSILLLRSNNRVNATRHLAIMYISHVIIRALRRFEDLFFFFHISVNTNHFARCWRNISIVEGNYDNCHPAKCLSKEYLLHSIWVNMADYLLS